MPRKSNCSQPLSLAPYPHDARADPSGDHGSRRSGRAQATGEAGVPSSPEAGEVLDAGLRRNLRGLGVGHPRRRGVPQRMGQKVRQTYCPDTDLDILREGTGKSHTEYLLELVFPDESVAPGPAVRAGDFAELLVSDFVEFMLGYWVPRGKYAEKGSRDESVKGVDIVGFKCPHAEQPKPSDEMLTFEAKAQLSGGKYGTASRLRLTIRAKTICAPEKRWPR